MTREEEAKGQGIVLSFSRFLSTSPLLPPSSVAPVLVVVKAEREEVVYARPVTKSNRLVLFCVTRVGMRGRGRGVGRVVKSGTDVGAIGREIGRREVVGSDDSVKLGVREGGACCLVKCCSSARA